ncbi:MULTISPECIES: FtsB family cell division protein [unclassified Sphingopyxis]|uniref:FtsB family cell division protein n=1 Tax=unclassified Sphingopyxis TaxID=2614943 RepID=UPI000737276E|nr:MULTISPECIES: septum formation initiator family protein [unclassified Sphingopyxis]KTE31901.1 septum formation initiator [Sphingopyxis sp. HIX]KTE80155.1 septum formation initiator [Sphingopyxis sp. HXXIV]
MTQRHKVRKSVNRAIGPTVAVLAVLAMIGYAIFGPTGLYAWGDYSQSVEKQRVVLAALTKKQDELKNRVNLLDRRRVDPDLADEYVREKLGVMHPDEVAIPMPPEGDAPAR